MSILSNVTLHTINIKSGKWNNTEWAIDDPIMVNDTAAQVLIGDVENPESNEIFKLILIIHEFTKIYF